MAMTNLNVKIEETIKEQAEEIYKELGLNMTTAINMFLRSTIREHGIPLNLKLDVPNDKTIAAIKEGKKLLNDSTKPGYSNIEDLKKALDE